MNLQGSKALRPIQCVRRISSAIPRRQKFAKEPPRVRPQRILPERANAESHCLEVLASAPFEGQEWDPQPSLFLGPPQKLHGPPVSSESALHLSSLGLGVSAPSKLVGWTKDSGQTMHRGRERAREGGLENYLRENTKAPNVGRTDDGQS